MSFADAVKSFRAQLVGYRQVTDAYLLGLSIRKAGRLATLDRGVISLLHGKNGERIVTIEDDKSLK